MLVSMGPTAARARNVLSTRTNQGRVMRLANNALAILFHPLAARAQVPVYVHFRWLHQERVQNKQILTWRETHTHAQC